MRIVLTQPLQKENTYFIPLGILSLASYLKPHGHQALLIDLKLLFKGPKYPKDFFRQAAIKILELKPRSIGFSVMCSTLPGVLLIAQECKNIAPEIPIIFGGPEVTFEEVELLRTFEQVDFIIRGEGEATLLELLNALDDQADLSNILGLTYRNGGQIQRNPDRPFIEDLDELPELDFDLLPDLKSYRVGKFEAGRGCPFNCTFCSTCKMWKRKLRVKSARRMAQEFEKVSAIFKDNSPPGLATIHVVHDNFLSSGQVADEFLSLVTGQGVTWGCSSRLEPLTEERLEKLRQANCLEIFIGIESASPQMQAAIKKNLPLKKLPGTLKLLSEKGIHAILSFVMGFPNENARQLNQTLLVALRSKLYPFPPTVQVSSFTFLKGSELFYQYKDRLKRAKFHLSNVSRLLTYLPEEIALIKKCPHIFFSFYYLPSPYFDLDFLQNICLLFDLLTRFFPQTVLLLMESRSISPLRMGQEILTFFKKTGVRFKPFKSEKEAFQYYSPAMRTWLEAHSNKLVQEAFKHESQMQITSSIDNYRPVRTANPTLTSRPRLSKKVKLIKYDHDVMGVMEALKHNSLEKMIKAPCFIAYVPGNNAQAFSIGPAIFHLLAFCNGKNSLQTILSKALSLSSFDPVEVDPILKQIQRLNQYGIIYLSKGNSMKNKYASLPGNSALI